MKTQLSRECENVRRSVDSLIDDLINEIQELEERIETLEDENSRLQDKLDELK